VDEDGDADKIIKEEVVKFKNVSIKNDTEKKKPSSLVESDRSVAAATDVKVEKLDSDRGHERKQVKEEVFV